MSTKTVQHERRLRIGWRRQQWLSQVALYLALSLAAVALLYPFWYMIISSLREAFYRFDAARIDLLPSAFNLAGYRKVFSATVPGASNNSSVLLNGFKNTMILEIMIVAASTVLNGMAAYAFAKRDFPGKAFFFTMLLTTIILPGEVTLVPKYVMFHRWGLLGTYWSLVLPALTGVFGIFLIRQFISTIPDALMEAARIDGANELQIILRIIFPLCVPALATYALFTFLGVWNDLLGPMIFLNKPQFWTLQYSLYVFTAQYPFQYGFSYGDVEGLRMQTLFAGLITSALPTIAVFVVFQRRLVGGITLTGLKG
jgi:multiple sugar transport system permease protein